MDGNREDLEVGPRRLGPAQGLVLTAATAALAVALVLVHGAEPAACVERREQGPPPASSAGPRPWAGVDSPEVRDLHFSVLDRERAAGDEPPAGALPADVRRSARKVGRNGGATFYLAGGSGFACLGASGLHPDGGPSSGASSVCLLTTSIANQGLTLAVTPKDGGDDLLVVAVPDGSELAVGPGTTRVAAYPNVAVLRPGAGSLVLTTPGRAPVPLRTESSGDVASAPC